MGSARSLAIWAAAVMAGAAGVSTASAQGSCPATAVLASVQGNVLINSGSGFTPARAGSVIRAGDQVSVRGSGNAIVDFGGGRVVNVPASSTQAVRAPGCGATIAQPADTTALIVGGIAGAAAIGGVMAANNGGGNDLPPIRPISP